MTPAELNALAIMLAEILTKDISAEELKILLQFVNMLSSAIRSYI